MPLLLLLLPAYALAFAATHALARNSLAQVPPMGWMSWELFRCEVNCSAHPDSCISERLYRQQADALVAGGYLRAGYSTIHIDDCWERKNPPRDPATGRLAADPGRFPSGMAALAGYLHSRGVSFGLYTAESALTCGGFPASAGHEELDAATFAGWGVDYLKVDGCGPAGYYSQGYPAMGRALEGSGRDVVYSCSWPAYLGDNESAKPFGELIDLGCNLWRVWDDIQCSWESLSSIIAHWGEWGEVLVPFAGPGHWHDPDMLLIGSKCLTTAEEQTQMAIWSIVAAPLIMGNDLRSISADSRAILLNEHAIAVNQDPLGQMGRLLPTQHAGAQTWARNLADGDVAVALFNYKNNSNADIELDFACVSLFGPIDVFDIWQQKSVGVFNGTFTAHAVPPHGSAFLRLSHMSK